MGGVPESRYDCVTFVWARCCASMVMCGVWRQCGVYSVSGSVMCSAMVVSYGTDAWCDVVGMWCA